MSESEGITTDEWRAELAVLNVEEPDEGCSVQEIADIGGRSEKRVRRRLAELRAEGRLQVGYRWAERFDGQPFRQKVFSVKPNGEE